MLKSFRNLFYKSEKQPEKKAEPQPIANDFDRWTELPPEIMRKIFAMLDSQSDLRAVSLVCRYWNSLTRDPLLWMNAFVDPPDEAPFVFIPSTVLGTREVTLDPKRENWKELVLNSIPLESLTDVFDWGLESGYVFVRKGVHDFHRHLSVPSSFDLNITIMGVSREESVIQCHNEGFIRYFSTAGMITIKNLTITQKKVDTDGDSISWVISSTGCGPTMQNCNIRAVFGAFGFRSENSTATIRNCDFSSETSSGVFSMMNARPTFVNCKVHDCKMSGFEMTSGSNLTITSCDLYNNQSGFFFYDSAKGAVTKCNVHHNSISGCFVRSDANPTVTDTTFHDNSYGIIADDNGSGLFLNTTFHTNDSAGVIFKSNSSTEIRNSKIYNNGVGVLYNDGSSGKLIGCEVYKSNSQGIYIRDKSTVHIEGCTIHHNKDAGLVLMDKIKGTIAHNRVASNNGGITYRTDEQEPFLDNDVDPDNEVVPGVIQRCLERGVCTYTVTRNVYFNQYYYFCEDCDPTHDLCFCVTCANACHKGHRLSKVKFGGFYCDCYKMNCKCKISKRVQNIQDEN